MAKQYSSGQVTKFADMFSAMGTEARLQIMRLLLKAHPDGLVVNEIQGELGIPGSTLSHHLDKLRHEGLVKVRRESTFLRYTADTQALQEVLQFLYAECCTRNQAVRPEAVVQIQGLNTLRTKETKLDEGEQSWKVLIAESQT